MYSLEGAALVRWEQQAPTVVDHAATVDALNAKGVGVWKGWYAYIVDDVLHLISTALEQEAQPATTLTICFESEYTFAGDELLARFMQQSPQTRVVSLIATNQSMPDELANAIFTRDGSIDLFMVRSNQTNMQGLVEQGFAAPIDDAWLVNDVEAMYPQIRDYLTHGGTLYGYPVQLDCHYWTVQPDEMAESAPGDVPQTVYEYLDRMLLWYEESFASRPTYSFSGNSTVADEWDEALSWLVAQYVYAYATQDAPLSFDTPVFRSALEKLAMLAPWKGQGSESTTQRAIFNTAEHASPLELDGYLYSDGAQFMLPPTFETGAAPAIHADLYYFIINPFSQNKEAAVRFLMYFGERMDTVTRYLFHSEYNELVEQQSYQNIRQQCEREAAQIQQTMQSLSTADAQELAYWQDRLEGVNAELAAAEPMHWVCTQEELAQYRAIAPYLQVEHGDMVWALCFDADAPAVLMRYLEGQTTLQAALSELDRKAMLLYREAQ